MFFGEFNLEMGFKMQIKINCLRPSNIIRLYYRQGPPSNCRRPISSPSLYLHLSGAVSKFYESSIVLFPWWIFDTTDGLLMGNC